MEEEKKELMTYQANNFVMAQRGLNMIQTRLLYVGMSRLAPQLKKGFGDADFMEVIIPAADIMKYFGSKNYYKKLEKESEKVQELLIYARPPEESDPEVFHRYNLFSKMEFSVEKYGGLLMRFNIDMRPFLLELFDKAYTRIAANDILPLQNPYGMRLLELMLQYQNITFMTEKGYILRVISIEEFRRYCNISDEVYPSAHHFTGHIIKPAVKDINNRSRYNITFETRKQGRTTIGYEFTMRIKDGFTQSDDFTPETADKAVADSKRIQHNAESATFDSDAEISRKLIYYGIGPRVSVKLVEEFGEKRCNDNLFYAIEMQKIGKVKKLAAYIRKAIENDWCPSDMTAVRRTESDRMKVQEDTEKEKRIEEALEELQELRGTDNRKGKLNRFKNKNKNDNSSALESDDKIALPLEDENNSQKDENNIINDNTCKSATEQIREWAKLKDEGLITEKMYLKMVNKLIDGV